MIRFQAHPTDGRRGFTLIELLVVLAIVAIMIGLSVTTATSLTRGLNITYAGNTIAATLENAREYAVSNNTDVEVRLYDYQPQGVATAGYYALQIFAKNTSLTATTFTALGPVVFLPAGTVISSITGDSTLIDNTLPSTSRTGVISPALPGIGTNYTYRYFTMLANGSTDLPSPSAIYDLTVLKPTDLNSTQTPANYSIVQVDPVTGHSTIHRP